MSEPTDKSRLLLTALYSAWITAFALSFYVFATSDQASRVGLFIGWQCVAGTLSFAIFGVSRNWSKGSAVRKLALLPLGVAALVAVGTLGISLWSQSSN